MSTKESETPLVLYGDGIHDDAEALDAWFNGLPTAWPDGSPVEKVIEGRNFKTSKILYSRILPDGMNFDDMPRLGADSYMVYVRA